MPYTLNGIGTWYYGRSRIHTLRDTCEFCGAFGEVSSYDTTHYFVFLYVPLLSLGKYRILNDCSICRKHRALKLKEWERTKSEAIEEVYARLREKLDDPEAVKHAIGVAIAYQDESLMLRVAEHLARPMANNADVQRVLGSAYGYFARSAEAEQAYRRSLELEENADTRRFLAIHVMRQGRADEAEAILRPLLDTPDPEHVGLLMLLIESYQSLPNHTRALELMAECERLAPDLSHDKSWLKLKKKGEKLARSGRAVRSATLGQSKTEGYREAGRGTWLARWVGPAVAAAAVIAYGAVAIYQAKHRSLFLVNGTRKPYTVAVNGHEIDLPPLAQRKVGVPEGDLAIASNDPDLKLPETKLHIATSFWTRPFQKPAFVVNPDRTALITWEKVAYGSGNAKVPDPIFELQSGELLYNFSQVDYAFQPFPQQIKIDRRSGVVKKTRVGTLSSAEYTPQALLLVAVSHLGPQKGVEHLRARLQFEPHDELLLAYVFRLMDRHQCIEFLKQRLDEKPTLVAWHRTYQHALESSGVDQSKIISEYRGRLTQNPEDAGLQYLLGRAVDDPAESESLFQKSAAGPPACAYGHHGLASLRVNAGEFAEAQTHIEQALRLIPDSELFLQVQREVWLANKRYDDILNYLRHRQQGKGYTFPFVLEEVRVMAYRGDRRGAEQRVQRYVGEQHAAGYTDPDSRQLVQQEQSSLRAAVAYAAGDVPGYLEAQNNTGSGASFEARFTAGDLDAARHAIANDTSNDDQWQRYLLLYIAHHAAGHEDAARQSLQSAIEFLNNGQRDERQLATLLGQGEFDPDHLPRISLRPDDKRIALSALGVRFPEHREDFLAMARRLNVNPDFPHLYLKNMLP